MRLKPNQYAKILYQLTVEESEKNRAANIRKFLIFLHKKQQLNLINKIIKQFELIYKQKQGITDVIITVAESHNEEELVNNLKHKISDKIDCQVKIDKSIIAGAIIQIGDLIYDNSVNNKLNILHNQLINN